MPAGCSCSCSLALFRTSASKPSLLCLSPSAQLERRGIAPFGVRRETSWCQDAFSAVETTEGWRRRARATTERRNGWAARMRQGTKRPSRQGGSLPPSLPPSPRPPIFHSRRCRSHPHREGRIWRRGAGRGHGVRRASGGLVSNRIGTSPALILLRHCCLVALNPFPPSFFRCLT